MCCQTTVSPLSTQSKWLVITAVSAVLVASVGNMAVAHGRPSLAAANTFQITLFEGTADEVSLEIRRDASNPRNWYYRRIIPTLCEKVLAGQILPAIRIVRFSSGSPRDGSSQRGGLLEFSVTMSLDEQQLSLLRSRVAERARIPEQDVTLELLPIESVEVSLYSGGDRFLNVATLGGGVVAEDSGRALTFLVELTDAGADVFDSLVDSPTGLPFAITFSFTGLTPKTNSQLHVHWDMVQRVLADDATIRIKLACLGRTSGSKGISDLQELKDAFERNACVTFTNGGVPISPEILETYYLPVMNVVRKALLEPMQADRLVVDDEHRNPPTLRQLTRTQIASLKSVFNFTSPQALGLNATSRGYIGIAGYPQSVRQLVVSTVPLYRTSSSLVLPQVKSCLGVDQVEFGVRVRHKLKPTQQDSQPVRWTLGEGWRKLDGASIDLLPIPVLFPGADGDNLDALEIESHMTIQAGQNTTDVYARLQPFRGVKNSPWPSDSMAVFELHSMLIPWVGVDTDPGTDKAIEVGGRFKAIYDDGCEVAWEVDLRPVVRGQSVDVPPVAYPMFANTNKNGGKLTSVCPDLRIRLGESGAAVSWSENNRNIYGDGSTVIFLSMDQFQSE